MDAWQGDWWARLYGRVRERGFDSVTSFAASMPRASLIDLADTLGPDVAAVQIERAMHAEAEHSGELGHFARDMLVREIVKWLPGGWRVQPDFESALAGAWADWKSLLDHKYSPATVRMLHWLKVAEIPTGWLPDGPTDPVIERAFAEVRFAPAGE